MKKPADTKSRNKFQPLRRQIAALFIGLLLLSLIAITAINAMFLEHYYISRKTEVLKEAVEKLEKLDVAYRFRRSVRVRIFQMKFSESVQKTI